MKTRLVLTPSTVLLILVIFALPLIWAAWRLWQDDALSKSIAEGKLNISSTAELLDLPPLVSKPLREALLMAPINLTNDLGLRADIAQAYQHRRPLDALGWLSSSEVSQALNDANKASEFLSVAHSLSRNHSTTLIKVFNQYLELGLVDEAMSVARDLVYAQPNKFRNVFYLLSQLTTDYRGLAREAIPLNVPDNRDYSADLYYSWALSDAIGAKNTLLAQAVWDAMPEQLQLNSRQGLHYLNYLVRQQSWQETKSVWQDLLGKGIVEAEILNADFELPMPENSPCWQTMPTPLGVAWSVDSNAYSGDASLMVKFDGTENVGFHHLVCLVSVKPNSSYRLTGMWKGAEISTLSGPFVDVFIPGQNVSAQRSEQKLNDWPWLKFEVTFDVPEGTEVASIRIRRTKSNLIDNQISGCVWFDELKLEKLMRVDKLNESQTHADHELGKMTPLL